MTVSGRPAVVTGAANGIGTALAAESARRGASVVGLVDVDEPGIADRADELRAAGHVVATHRCDVSDASEVDALAAAFVAEHGVPGLVCANAGVMVGNTPLLDLSAADAAWTIEVNVLGTFHTLQAFGRLMAQADEPGWLLATGSEHSIGVPKEGSFAYTASKHAVLGMCDVLRRELPAHLGVSVVLPGLTATALWNATTNRPKAAGGPATGNALAGRFTNTYGMAPEIVAARALDGVEAGHFLIPTHANARAYAERRAAELDAAFDRLTEIDSDDYDVDRLRAEFITQIRAEQQDRDQEATT
ncbi:MAG: SDR family NAD(P)-dependent oxidoreductase [Actinomycetota bacterium]